MQCISPLKGYRLENGEIIFHSKKGGYPLIIPCGQCIGCKLERSRQWATRLTHELRYHDEASFITLTYDEEHLPSPPSLNLKHFQDFMKRLRKKLSPKKLRFYHCGEYGEQNRRPHYHAIIFGESFSVPRSKTRQEENGTITWQSNLLDELWPFGLNRVGSVTFESCAYVARYITKKISGPNAQEHYQGLAPEYATMSRRPGIGSKHFDDYQSEIYGSDSVIVRGKECRPPKTYDRWLEKKNNTLYIEVKENRELTLDEMLKVDNSDLKLRTKGILINARRDLLNKKGRI